MLGEYKKALLLLFGAVALLTGWAWFLKSPAAYPGLEERASVVLALLLVLVLVAYVDWRKAQDAAVRARARRLSLLLRPLVRMHGNVRYLFHVSFQAVLVLYLLLLLADQFVDWNLPLGTLLVLTIILGVASVLLPYESRTKRAMTRRDIALIVALALAGGFLVFLKTSDLGWLRYAITALSALLIGLLGFLVFEDDDADIAYPDFGRRAIVPAALLLLGAASLGFIFFGTGALRIILGSVYVLFLPGLFLSYVFFEQGEIDALERVALSFALSIAAVPLLVFYLNLLGMKITALSVSLVVLGILVLSAAAYRKRTQLRRVKLKGMLGER